MVGPPARHRSLLRGRSAPAADHPGCSFGFLTSDQGRAASCVRVIDRRRQADHGELIYRTDVGIRLALLLLKQGRARRIELQDRCTATH